MNPDDDARLILSSTLKVLVENVQEEAYRIAAKDIMMNLAQVGEVLRLERFPGFSKEKTPEPAPRGE